MNVSIELLSAVYPEGEKWSWVATNVESGISYPSSDYFNGVNYDSRSEALDVGIDFANKKMGG